MSPMHLLLEGPDLQTLLEQVRTEYGTTARIVHAEKVRRGGVGGFFARERFNIQVEVSEPPPTSQPTTSVPPGRGTVQSVMDLVDQLNLEEKGLYQDIQDSPRPPTPAPSTSPFVEPPPAHALIENPPPATPDRALGSSSASVSTQSAAFTDVMSRLQQSIDPGIAGPAEAPWSPGPPRREGTLRPAALAQPPIQTVPPVRRGAERGPTATGAMMAAQATRMGVPTHVLAGIEDPADVYRRLLVWVQSRPVAPMVVSIPGQIIAVVGEVRASMDVAASLAHQLGVDPAATHLAVLASSTGYGVPAGQLLSDVSDMAVRRQRWQHSACSTIVVVEAALPPAARGWLAAVISALAPTFTWAVAQASTKVNDVVSWAGAVGEVDALALMNVSATGDPASALAGPLPIGLLDDQRATVTRWMAMLTEEGERR